MKWNPEQICYIKMLRHLMSWKQIAKNVNERYDIKVTANAVRKAYKRYSSKDLHIAPEDVDLPKVLIFDLETAPMLAYLWSLYDPAVGLNQVVSHSYVLSWSAKWLGDPEDKVMYMDQRYATNIEDDSEILLNLWELLDEADIVVAHNGDNFDIKVFNTRIALLKGKPTSSFKSIDTCKLAKKFFKFPSNKLQHLTDKLCVKYKKSTHAKYSGFSLWRECLLKNMEAFKEMEDYNRLDVLSLEELLYILLPWEPNINFGIYSQCGVNRCSCNNEEFLSSGFTHTKTGKFEKFRCSNCGKEYRSRKNVLTKESKSNMIIPNNRK